MQVLPPNQNHSSQIARESASLPYHCKKLTSKAIDFYEQQSQHHPSAQQIRAKTAAATPPSPDLAHQPPPLLPPDLAGEGDLVYEARSMESERMGLGVLSMAIAAILAPLAFAFPFVD